MPSTSCPALSTFDTMACQLPSTSSSTYAIPTWGSVDVLVPSALGGHWLVWGVIQVGGREEFL